MNQIDEIRSELAAIAPGFRTKLRSYPESQPAWVMRDESGKSGVFFALPINWETRVIYEEFSNVSLETVDAHVDGMLRNCLALYCLDHSQRENFSVICQSFLDPNQRSFVSADPARWWLEWSELMGNANQDHSPHSILAELFVWQYMLNSYLEIEWSGPNGSSHDLVGTKFDVEVKATTRHHGKQVTISSANQLGIAQGKRLFLAFIRMEPNIGSHSIETVKRNLTAKGVNEAKLEAQLRSMGSKQGMGNRSRTYMVHEAEIYEVGDNFPRIAPCSFVDGVLPSGIGNIKYDIDLSLLRPFSTLDGFTL